MSNDNNIRVDEVSKYYEPAKRAASAISFLFWVTAVVSLFMPYTSDFGKSIQNLGSAIFIILVIIHFAVSLLYKLHFVPRAEHKRRRQMLSDAFGTPLSDERTHLYYNNNYAPSIIRLGANIMENALFSKEIAAKMLVKTRLIIGFYIILWAFIFALRHDNINILIGFTQLLFSGAIVFDWLSLEILRYRHENIYEQLHSFFLHRIGGNGEKAIATILDSFADYETTKANSGVLLSSKVFFELNPSLTQKWIQVRTHLNMDNQ
jgi:hypothetical protein